MCPFHIRRAVALIAAVSLTTAMTASAASAPKPAARLAVGFTPIAPAGADHGAPIRLELEVTIAQAASSALALRKIVVHFPPGFAMNGALFPSCSAAQLRAAHGDLGACPRGSRVGTGRATIGVVGLAVRSQATLALFNGVGGRSVTFNVRLAKPARIDVTFSASLQPTPGGRGYVLSAAIPAKLRSVVGSAIVVRRIRVRTGTMRVVDGADRGYLEAFSCPRSHRLPFRTDLTFSGTSRSRANATLRC